jgi:hypothetical protein
MKWLALFLALIASPCWAQSSQMLLLGAGGGLTYTGPGDIVSGATAWYGLRAYNAAYATGSNNAVNVRRASDNTTQNIVILSNGQLDIATATTFAGVDQTATCSTSGSSTTLSCTGASATPNSSEPLTGTGFVQPAYSVSCGAFVAGAGTCTMNVAQNISSTTVTFHVALFITEIFDQTGGNNCGSASCNLLQATAANQPQLLPSCVNSQPCMLLTGTSLLQSAHALTQSTTASFSAAADRTASTGKSVWILDGTNNTSDGSGIQARTTANSWALIASNNVNITVTASDSAWHAANGENGTSSQGVINIDGTDSATSSTSNGTASTTPLMALGSGAAFLAEGGIWEAKLFSSGNRTSICKNQQAFYGASNFGATC